MDIRTIHESPDLFKKTTIERYVKSRTGNPIPWVGMPVYYTPLGKWFIVTGESHTNIEIYSLDEDYRLLYSYADDKTTDPNSEFILSGQSNTPEIPIEFSKTLYYIYLEAMKKPIKFYYLQYIDNIWHEKEVQCGQGWTEGLILPPNTRILDVLPNNNSIQTTEIEALTLKTLNQDGRSACAQCGQELYSPWPDYIYCKKCEE